MRRLALIAAVTVLISALASLSPIAQADIPNAVPPLDLGLLGSDPEPSAPDTSAPAELTRLRLTLRSTTDWALADVVGSWLISYRIVDTSPGAVVSIRDRGLELNGPTPAFATIDAVFQVDPNTETGVILQKGWMHSASIEVQRINADPVLAVSLANNKTYDDSPVYREVPASTLIGEGLRAARMDSRRLSLAFYYPGFHRETFSQGRWSARPAGPYATNVSSDVRGMIDQAASSGIDGFLVSYDRDYRPEYNLAFDVAEARGGFLLAPLLEVSLILENYGTLDAVVQGAVEALSKRSSPAFLRVGSRPVMFVYGSSSISSSAWSSVRNRIASATGVQPFYVGDSDDVAYGYNGFYVYNPNGTPLGDLGWHYAMTGAELRLAPQRLWAATVSPGYDDTALKWRPSVAPREDGARYDAMWYAALGSAPEWILITSWNEWLEGTQIAPDDVNGTRALDQTRAWTPQFR